MNNATMRTARGIDIPGAARAPLESAAHEEEVSRIIQRFDRRRRRAHMGAVVAIFTAMLGGFLELSDAQTQGQILSWVTMGHGDELLRSIESAKVRTSRVFISHR